MAGTWQGFLIDRLGGKTVCYPLDGDDFMKKNNGRCRQILLKIKKWWKWQCLKPKIRNINEIHGRLTGNGEKVGFFEKRDIKKEFNECRALYDQYIDYCKKNELLKLRTLKSAFVP